MLFLIHIESYFIIIVQLEVEFIYVYWLNLQTLVMDSCVITCRLKLAWYKRDLTQHTFQLKNDPKPAWTRIRKRERILKIKPCLIRAQRNPRNYTLAKKLHNKAKQPLKREKEGSIKKDEEKGNKRKNWRLELVERRGLSSPRG